MRESRPFLPHKNKNIKDEMFFQAKTKIKTQYNFPRRIKSTHKHFNTKNFPTNIYQKKFIEIVKLPKQKTFN
jgi:hypothetical protein